MSLRFFFNALVLFQLINYLSYILSQSYLLHTKKKLLFKSPLFCYVVIARTEMVFFVASEYKIPKNPSLL